MHVEAIKSLRIAVALALVVGAGFGQSAWASETDVSAQPTTLVRPEAPKRALGEGLARNITHVTEGAEAIGDRWRKRLSFLESRDLKRAEEQLVDIGRVQTTLAFDNLFAVSTALVREAREALAEGHPDEALGLCRRAVSYAPDLPDAHACVASILFETNPTAVGALFDAWKARAQATWKDVRFRRHLVTDEAVALVLALVVACALWVFLLVLRYAGLFFHDFHHLFPKGVSQWQSVLAGSVIVALPALLGLGWLATAAAAAMAIAFFVSRREGIALALSFALLAVSQFAVAYVVEQGALGQTATDVFELEQGAGTAAALARLERELADGRGSAATAFALGRHYKRVGQYELAEARYRQALKFAPETAHTLNNLGTVRFLVGDTAGALELFRRANALAPGAPEPLHNLAKMYFREGRLAPGEEAQRAAIALGGQAMSDRLGVHEDMRANLFVLDLRLPDAAFERLLASDRENVTTLDGALVKEMVGSLGSRGAGVVALVPIVFLGLGAVLRKRVRPATKCEKCGRPVCRRCDAELGATSALCSQCISVFVRRSGVDQPDRIRKEMEVRRFQRRQVVWARVAGGVIPGGGHVFSGRLVAGGFFLFLFSAIVAKLLLPTGFLPSPSPLPSVPSSLRLAVLVALLVVLYLFSLRHLVRRERAD